jgi:hypothetical protein
MKILLPLIIVLFAFTGVSTQTSPIIYVAGDGTGDYNCDGISDQIEINQALDYVATHSNFTTVYLKGVNIFEIDEPVFVSSNTIVTGDPTAVLKLKDNAAWWTQDKPMIAQTNRNVVLGYDGDGMGDNIWNPYGHENDEISNVEIYGFTIDAGMFQEEPSGSRYNALLHFTFPYNILIHDIHFINGQWDAIRLSALGTTPIDCIVYDNLIDANGHDAISFVGVNDFEAYGNEVYKTRTNSGLRATECDNFSFHNNIVGNSISKPSSGYAGIQIQNDIFPCNYAEIYENVIYGKDGGIHVSSVESNTYTYPTGTRKNVHVHHNKIYKMNAFDIGGGITLDGGIVINGFHNILIEHNVIDGGITDGIIFKGTASGGTGYQNTVQNNIIINNAGYGISNEEPSINTFIINNNLIYNNDLGDYNNTYAIDDVNRDPIFGVSHSPVNQWHHIVASFDNYTETMKIYIDGVEKSSMSYPELFGTIGSNSYNLYLGSTCNGNYFFEGYQDELAIWNRALTTSEISILYNNGVPENITGSVTIDMQAYFKMENNWNDASGNAYDAEYSTASFTTDAINGTHAGLFDGIDDGVQYPNNLSTTNGLSISVWVYRTGLNEEIQTIVNKGKQDDFNHIWLYFRGESVLFELGNGMERIDLEAYITNPENIDYHLKSAYGRWDGSLWVNDAVTSPCVNSGDASSDYSNEPTPNGNCVNIGVYGNTNEASKSPYTVGLNDFDMNEIIIYPNPTTEKIFLSEQFLGKKYQILSLTGTVVQNAIISTNYIDLSNIETGIYFIKIAEFEKKKINFVKVIKK